MKGALAAIVGPSGVGKDALLAHARQALAGEAGFLFPRRLVTRPANPHEPFDSIDAAAFDAAEQAGDFCLSWRANGLAYAVPKAALDAARDGSVIVLNLSRAGLPQARAVFPRSFVIHVRARPETILARMKARGRDDAAGMLARLERGRALDADVEADLRIDNDGALAEAADRLVAALRGLGAETRA